MYSNSKEIRSRMRDTRRPYSMLASLRNGEVDVGTDKTVLRWRQGILHVVCESLHLIEPDGFSEQKLVWRIEAKQRAANFVHLGFSELRFDNAPIIRQQECRDSITSTAPLAATYQLLARCTGSELAECNILLQEFLMSLVAVYSPVYGKIELSLATTSIILTSIKCRALLLGIGTLFQSMMRDSRGTGCSLSLDIEPSADKANYCLHLGLTTCHSKLLASSEFDLASRLFGILQAELFFSSQHNSKVCLRLLIPREKA